MEILNAMDLRAGKKADPNRMMRLTQPLQFLSEEEKDDEWHAWNSDWLEWYGLKQIGRNARRFAKNFKLAKGIIDRTDYIMEQDNEMKDLVHILSTDNSSALDLKFYPLIPPIINTLCSEFAKRNTKINFYGNDEDSINEKDQLKIEQISEVLIADAEKKVLTQMINMGMDPNDPQVQQQMQQQLDPQNLKTLPEIQQFFTKTYRSQAEQWAMHQYHADVEYFRLNEMEELQFRNMLITDREFWHFLMFEDDYGIEMWNPMTTFYHKSPSVRYISEGNWVGNIEMLTVADVIDKYGWLMTEDQMEALEAIYPARSAGYPVYGYQNDGSYYDATRSHAWNVNQPGLAYRQWVSMFDNTMAPGGDVLNWIMSQNEDYPDGGNAFMLRVTTSYWKSQRKVGHLTKIDDNGEIIVDIVDESYKVTDKPVYNTLLVKNKSADNLVAGEHIDWIWINQTRGCVKIGPNRPSWWGMKNPGGVNPMYLGINSNKPGPIKFQFKGDKTLYGCKLPVEGRVFSDYNTRSTSLTDLLKPSQVGYNMVCNQAADILIDELGTVVMFDQNALPKHSLGEDWGKANLSKAYVSMKQFQMLPLDTSIANTEGQIQNTTFQKLDLSQTERLLSRIQLADYFRRQAFELIGFTPQRVGQGGERQTATGVEENLKASTAQTEIYFIQHCDQLMPRVHQMRTDLAQYYHSTKPSVRLQYVTSKDERVNFEINGTDLLTKQINCIANTDSVARALMDEFKKLVFSNNTGGASLVELGRLLAADSVAEVQNKMNQIEENAQKKVEAERAHEEQMKQMEIDAAEKEKQLELDRQAMEKEKDRRANILIAEIRAAGYGAAVDKNANQQSDFLDFMDQTRKTTEYQDTMNFEREKEQNKQSLNQDKQNIQREKMATQMRMKEMDLQIAQENKNASDLAAARKAKESKKKK